MRSLFDTACDTARYHDLDLGSSFLPRSLENNILTNYGKDMSAVLKLAEVLPSTSITSLECLPQLLWTARH